jgi:hypothetical protein
LAVRQNAAAAAELLFARRKLLVLAEQRFSRRAVYRNRDKIFPAGAIPGRNGGTPPCREVVGGSFPSRCPYKRAARNSKPSAKSNGNRVGRGKFHFNQLTEFHAVSKPGRAVARVPPASPFCRSCGGKVEPADRFCMNCGATLVPREGVPSPTSEPQPVEHPVAKSRPTSGAVMTLITSLIIACASAGGWYLVRNSELFPKFKQLVTTGNPGGSSTTAKTPPMPVPPQVVNQPGTNPAPLPASPGPGKKTEGGVAVANSNELARRAAEQAGVMTVDKQGTAVTFTFQNGDGTRTLKISPEPSENPGQQPPSRRIQPAGQFLGGTSPADEHFAKGIEFAENRNWLQAEAHYREALRLNPNLDDCWHALGEAFFEQKKWPDAVSAYQQAARLQPTFGIYYADLAQAFLRQGRRPEAIKAAQEAIRLGEEEHPVFNQLGLKR